MEPRLPGPRRSIPGAGGEEGEVPGPKGKSKRMSVKARLCSLVTLLPPSLRHLLASAPPSLLLALATFLVLLLLSPLLFSPSFLLSLWPPRGPLVNVGGPYGWGRDVLHLDSFQYPHMILPAGTTLNFTSALDAPPKRPSVSESVLSFLQGSGRHKEKYDVWEMRSESAFANCDFVNATLVGVGPAVFVPLSIPGERFFSSSHSRGLNCHDGQKIHVTVTPAPPHSPPTT